MNLNFHTAELYSVQYGSLFSLRSLFQAMNFTFPSCLVDCTPSLRQAFMTHNYVAKLTMSTGILRS